MKEGLTNHKACYLVVNSNTSDFLKEIKFQLIPRYLLIDKNGKIIHLNAPRPSGKQIIELIDNAL
jgi:hypothetical protein